MKVNLLTSSAGVSFLYLLAGFLPAQAMPAVEQAIYDTQSAKDFDNPAESQHKNNDDLISENANKITEFTANTSTILNQKQQDTDIPGYAQTGSKSSGQSLASDVKEQVTSVSQLSDVQPTDWAFGALQSLVERYGCIAGYPNSTFGGNRPLTRYEFAGGLNACLNRVNELIAAATADLVSKADLATLQKLQAEFAAELSDLRGRVDTLEAHAAELEANQFSTTTKLSGEVIISAIGATGGAGGKDDPNTMLTNRVRLNLNTSFTGRDLLITGLQAHNFLGGVNGSGSLQDSLGLASPVLSASSARTSVEPQFPGVNVSTLSGVAANSVQLYKLVYIFPVAEKLTLFAGTAAEVSDAFPAITPFAGEGQESISRFGNLNPVVRVSGGTSGSGLASAAGFIYSFSPQLDLRGLYGSVNANLPTNQGFPNTPLGAGVFGGSSVIATQLTVKPTRNIDVGLNYANSYHQINILGTGLMRDDIGALAGVDLTTPVKLNSVGGTVNWRLSNKIALSGYGAAIFVDSAKNARDSTTFTSWMVGVHFQDLIKQGNTAGLLFGQPLYRSEASGTAQIAAPGTNRATPYHLEGYYRFRVSDNISVTPGAFVLFNPEGDSKNETTTVGVVRTTFTF